MCMNPVAMFEVLLHMLCSCFLRFLGILKFQINNLQPTCLRFDGFRQTHRILLLVSCFSAPGWPGPASARRCATTWRPQGWWMRTRGTGDPRRWQGRFKSQKPDVIKDYETTAVCFRCLFTFKFLDFCLFTEIFTAICIAAGSFWTPHFAHNDKQWGTAQTYCAFCQILYKLVTLCYTMLL